ncbi:MAG: hypothetical protein Q8Q23_05485 [bacterium]|nr:hypothetical protein [bacterium]
MNVFIKCKNTKTENSVRRALNYLKLEVIDKINVTEKYETAKIIIVDSLAEIKNHFEKCKHYILLDDPDFPMLEAVVLDNVCTVKTNQIFGEFIELMERILKK